MLWEHASCIQVSFSLVIACFSLSFPRWPAIQIMIQQQLTAATKQYYDFFIFFINHFKKSNKHTEPVTSYLWITAATSD